MKDRETRLRLSMLEGQVKRLAELVYKQTEMLAAAFVFTRFPQESKREEGRDP